MDHTVITVPSVHNPTIQHHTHLKHTKQSRSDRFILFISNLNTVNTKTTRAQLHKILKVYGLKKLSLPCNQYGHIRGYAFATLISAAQCESAIHELCNVVINNQLLCISHTLGKIDILYPLVPYNTRKQIQCDSYSLMGATDQLTAIRITSVLYNITHCIAYRYSNSHMKQQYTVLDCTGCIGAQSIALADQFDQVTVCELDSTRYNMLQHNVELLNSHKRNITAINCDSNTQLPCSDPTTAPTIISIDPMWQQPNESYTDHATIHHNQLALGNKSISDIVIELRERSGSSVVCIGLPYNYDVTTLAQLCVIPANNDSATPPNTNRDTLDERPFPFTMEFGKRILFILCLPHVNEYNHEMTRSLDYCNSTLDSVIAQLVEFNQLYKLDHKPKFFDYEKQRWISLMRWNGNKMIPVQ